MGQKPDSNSPELRALKELVQTNHAGQQLGFDESIDRMVANMDLALSEIGEGNYNGMRIRDSSKTPQYLQVELQKILDTGAVLTNAAVKNGGWQTLSVEFNDRSHNFDLSGAEKKLEGAINRWMDFVNENPSLSPGLPLAINSAARHDPSHKVLLRETLKHTIQGHSPMAFIGNEDAERRMQPSAAKPVPMNVS